MKKLYPVLLLLIFCFWLSPICKADSLEVNKGSLPQVLLSIAAANNLNMVLAPEIQGDLTISLQNMPPKEMIQAIALGHDLHYEEANHIIYITPAKQGKTLRSVNLNYLNLELASKTVRLVLNTKSSGNKKESGQDNTEVICDPYENTISFYATDQEYNKIMRLLLAQDLPPKQVSLEAKILALEKSASKDLGLDWSWSSIPNQEPLSDDYDNDRHSNSNRKNNQGENYTRAFGTGLRFGKNITGLPYEIGISAKLNALISQGKANVLAKPNITTIQGQEAVINIGGEVPVQTTVISDNTTTTSVSYRPAGIILKCKPRVNEPGIITVEVHTEVSNPSYIDDLKAFRFQKRSADTVVRLKDGETMVIGGLINQDEINNMSRVPLLSKIPLLGNLFKHSQKSKRSTEVMIFLTAKEVA